MERIEFTKMTEEVFEGSGIPKTSQDCLVALSLAAALLVSELEELFGDSAKAMLYVGRMLREMGAEMIHEALFPDAS